MKHFYPCLSLLLSLVVLSAGAQTAASGAPSVVPAFAEHASASSQSGAPQQLQAQAEPPQRPNVAPDPLLDVPPLPKGKVTLVGGTVKSIDRIRNKLHVQVFGGRVMKVNFDERTHIFRDGIETTQLGIRKGDRVYVDTMLDGPQVLARNIRVQTGVRAADSAGQVLSRRDGTITVRDQLSAQPVTFATNQNTAVVRDKHAATLAEITPGSIVAVTFAPEHANHGVAREISIIATPGMQFAFAGRVTHIDLRARTFSLENETDGKTYDLNFDPVRVDNRDAFGVGAQVTVPATFEGSAGYRADRVTVTASPEPASAKQ